MADGREMKTPFLAGRYCEHDMLYRQINDDNVQLIVIGRNERYPLYTMCIAADDLYKFRSLDAEIQSYSDIFQNRMIHKPLIGEVIMAKMDFGWARCQFLGYNGTMADVYCIDYGTIVTIERGTIRVIFILDFHLIRWSELMQK